MKNNLAGACTQESLKVGGNVPNYIVGIYEEAMATVIVEADDDIQAADKVAAILEDENTQHLEDIANLEDVTYEEQYRDVGVAIDASDPEDIRLAISELIHDS